MAFFAVHLLLVGRFGPWNYLGALPPILFLLLPAALAGAAASARDRRAGALALLLFLPGVTQADMNWSALLPRRMERAGVDNVVLFNWNTRFWNESGGRDFYDYLRRQDADVYHLQERWGTASHPLEDSIHGLATALEGYTVVERGEFVTATRLRVVSTSGSDEQKFLRVDVKRGDTVMSFYNVHISMPFGADLVAIQARRLDQLAALRDDLRRNPNPVVISGDFNATTSMGVMAWFFDSYIDSYTATAALLPTTWSYHRLPWLKLWRLDYVFVDDRLRVMAHADVEPFESDHWGQLVTVARVAR